jgi:chemosensory pili system protein ChpA (sensor histidine kinase/response regulator)
MRLLAPYLEVNRARGANDATEGDLFFPDLATQLPAAPAGEALDDAVLAKALQLQRSTYQQGLLKMLKGVDSAEALRQMQSAVSAIESLQASTPNRAFWAAASGFFDALVFGGLAVGPSSKPLFAKVDQQVKQLIDGSGKVAERLLRPRAPGVRARHDPRQRRRGSRRAPAGAARADRPAEGHVAQVHLR